MLIRIPRGWEITEREATPEHRYLARREFLRGLVSVAPAAALAGLGCSNLSSNLVPVGKASPKKTGANPAAILRPLSAPRNARYTVDHPITSEIVSTGYNNYYEFTELKDQVRKVAQDFESRPWTVEIKGLVEKPRKIDVDDLIKLMPLEERVYRHRCVEAWTIFVPWIGFPMKKFVEWCAPLSKARYVRMVSFFRPGQAIGQMRSTWYPWPYYEGLTMGEATNELALLVVGMYGKTLPNQNGAPLRLHTPWKYGYKSIKGIVRFEFVEKQPRNFWGDVVPTEYDFWANVNPAKPHPRWSQASERLVETGERVPTRPYNGYEKYVAHLYK